jgi:hypothetical protein
VSPSSPWHLIVLSLLRCPRRFEVAPIPTLQAAAHGSGWGCCGAVVVVVAIVVIMVLAPSSHCPYPHHSPFPPCEQLLVAAVEGAVVVVVVVVVVAVVMVMVAIIVIMGVASL